MTDDLRRALDDLAARTADEHTGRGGLPVAAMTARARRNRLRRTALVSGAVTAVLVGVAAAGAAVTSWDRAEPLPAGSPTTAATTPPTATPSAAAVLPTGDTTLPFGACGSVVGAATEPATDPTAGYVVTAPSAVLGGEAVAVSARLAPPATATQGFVRASGPTTVLTHDGVVVAVAPTSVQVSDEPSWFTFANPLVLEHLVTSTTHVVPTVCDDGSGTGQAGRELPAGIYQVVVLGEVWFGTTDPDFDGLAPDETVAEFTARADVTQVTAVSDPVDLTISEQRADSPAEVPTGTPQLTAGQPDESLGLCLPTEPVTGTDFTVSWPGDSLTITAGQARVVDLTTTYEGPGRAGFTTTLARLELFQDGVRTGFMYSPDARALDGDHGSTSTLSLWFNGMTTCGDDGEATSAIPPGTYDVRPSVLIGLDRLTASDGTPVLGGTAGGEGRWFVVAGETFTLVVE